MTKDDLMQMARDAEIYSDDKGDLMGRSEFKHLELLANAILERAAVELYSVSTIGSHEYEVREDCLSAIRALKIPEGE